MIILTIHSNQKNFHGNNMLSSNEMVLHLSIRKDVNMKKIHMHDFNSGLILFNKDATGLYHQPKKLPNF